MRSRAAELGTADRVDVDRVKAKKMGIPLQSIFSTLQAALGTAVFGGMIASTMFGIFLVPVFYVIVQRTAEFIGGKKG